MSDSDENRGPDGGQSGITRGDLLKTAAAGAGVLIGAGATAPGADAMAKNMPAHREVAGMNVLVFLTDQQRAVQHFPPGWVKRNMPGLHRLQQHGLTFENAFTNACMCSPARSTLMSGYFPAQHGVKYTLETDMPSPQYPQVELSTTFKNPASVVASAGYTPVYKGKFHCVKPANGSTWVPSDVNQYGFTRWDPPDAGANQDVSEEGGGDYDNDGRFINSEGSAPAGTEGAIQYLKTAAAQSQPFCLIVSLVNPHDVLLYPKTYTTAGYDSTWLQGEIDPPATVNEDLSTKPTVQKEFLHLFNAFGPDSDAPDEAQLPQLLRQPDEVIGRLPGRDPRDAREHRSPEGHVGDRDLRSRRDGHLPRRTAPEELQRLRGVDPRPPGLLQPAVVPEAREERRAGLPRRLPPDAREPGQGAVGGRDPSWEGVDYSDLILKRHAKPPQDYTVFTYDDYQSGQANGPYPRPPNHVVSIRERRYKIARYYDVNGKVPDQWEMYDLVRDPLERKNLAYKHYKRTPAQERQYKRLRAKLAKVERTRLQPLS